MYLLYSVNVYIVNVVIEIKFYSSIHLKQHRQTFSISLVHRAPSDMPILYIGLGYFTSLRVRNHLKLDLPRLFLTLGWEYVHKQTV